jgi:predicted RNA binding protein YcfA (HicA-like mRNA interferase family)
MTKRQKTLSKTLAGSRNVSFDEFRLLVESFGFRLSRVRGSHHVFTHPKVKELVNLQNVKGQVKPYQVKQVMELVERYSLTLEDER